MSGRNRSAHQIGFPSTNPRKVDPDAVVDTAEKPGIFSISGAFMARDSGSNKRRLVNLWNPPKRKED